MDKKARGQGLGKLLLLVDRGQKPGHYRGQNSASSYLNIFSPQMLFTNG